MEELGVPQNRICLFVTRWHGWPGWTPLLLHTLASNRALVDFHLLSDTAPVERLPSNVAFHRWTLPELLERMHKSIGVTLEALTASGTASSFSGWNMWSLK